MNSVSNGRDSMTREALIAELIRVKAELAIANEKLAQANSAATSAVDFMRFGPPRANDGNIIGAHRVEPAELLATNPEIADWLTHCQDYKQPGVLYDGGDFVVVCVRPLGN